MPDTSYRNPQTDMPWCGFSKIKKNKISSEIEPSGFNATAAAANQDFVELIIIIWLISRSFATADFAEEPWNWTHAAECPKGFWFCFLKTLTTACPLEDFDTVCGAWVEVYINATGEFSVCMYVSMFGMYVCMFEGPEHVCMFECPKRVCYVWTR